MDKHWFWRIGWVLVAAGVAFIVWKSFQPQHQHEGLASSNGRIEAVEIDIATKAPGRIKEILVSEGDFVNTGEVLARMDTSVLEAQRREAEAQLQRALIGVKAAHSQVDQRKAEKRSDEAVVAQRQAERDAAQKRLERSRNLAAREAVSEQVLDDDRASFQAARAAVAAAEAMVAASEAALNNAQAEIIAAESAVDAAQATVQRIQADINDTVLLAPRNGRVQYRVAQPGEVLGAGSPVLNMVDLTDVYMTFFLPTAQAGRVALDTEARLVLDAAPQYVIPAHISFVADVAQFTPKTVETAEERQKLMFRIKARIEPELLRKHLRQVKTGLPGMAYVRLDPKIEWPPELELKLP